MAVERQIELKRRYNRKAKMIKLKKKLGTETGEAREKVLAKIKRLSPWWTEAALEQGKPGAAAQVAKEPKKKAAPKAAKK
ncbi:hypothetical protein BH11PLA2_BH11PLA2_06660 [soil metagenome]